MSRKALGIAIVIIGAIMLAGFVYFLFFSQTTLLDRLSKYTGGSGPAAPTAPAGETAADAPAAVKRIEIDKKTSTGTSSQPVGSESLSTARDGVARMAASFAERFGSYSNQSNFSNIIDLKIFMSSRMQAWADDYVRSQRREEKHNDIYFGITTKAIAQAVSYYDDHVGRAEVLVNTRRREAVNSTSNVSNIFNQDIIINFIQEKGAWKVDSASWQDKL